MYVCVALCTSYIYEIQSLKITKELNLYFIKMHNTNEYI